MIYLKLFRWPNLLVVAFTQYLFRYCIVEPLLEANNIPLVFSNLDFFLLVLATIMVTAAGYAINDYFDLRIDRINKPHKVILGKRLSRRKAIFSHTVLNIIAFIIGLYLAYKARYLPLAGVFVIVPALLWLYSIRYKRKFLVGNIITAILPALVIAIVWGFEYRGLIYYYNPGESLIISVNQYLRVYALFAFLITLIREIIKDIEDMEGDKIAGCKTIPVVSGTKSSKSLIMVLTGILISFVGYFQFYMLGIDYDLIFAYLLFAVQVPLIILIYKIYSAKEKKDYNTNSKLVKFIMVTGVFSMFLLYYYI